MHLSFYGLCSPALEGKGLFCARDGSSGAKAAVWRFN